VIIRSYALAVDSHEMRCWIFGRVVRVPFEVWVRLGRVPDLFDDRWASGSVHASIEKEDSALRSRANTIDWRLGHYGCLDARIYLSKGES